MTRNGRLIGAVATAVALSGPSPSTAKEPEPLRAELEMVEAMLDRAVAQVSRARAGLLLGGERSRGYHLKGYGAVFVLAPRLLPRGQRVIVMRGGSLEAGAHARRAPSPAPRPAQSVDGGGRGRTDEQLQLIVDQLEAFQRETELSRLEAEERLDRIAREMRARWGAPPPDVEAPLPAPAPASPAALPPSAPAAAPAPPWRFWFETDVSEEERSPERIVGDVRAAVTGALEADGVRLRFLGPEEFVAVAVDFVPAGVFTHDTRPERTLVVRVRKKELEQRRAGAIAPEELRRRIEYVEY